MSELLVNTIKKADGTGSLSVPAESGTVVTTASPSLGRRNLVQNGSMIIDQRNGGSSITPTNGQFGADRWHFAVAQASKFTAQQVTDAPAGFSHSLKVTSSSAYTVGANDYFLVQHGMEGNNVSQLELGTSDAQEFTLSFWVKSSLTGTFGGAFRNFGIYNRTYIFEYTINAADTWEQKTVTLTGDTTGSWNSGVNGSLAITFSVGSGANFKNTAGSWIANNDTASTGSTDVVATNGATWYITGVQLEVGSVATPFEHRSYGEELALCQRYYYKKTVGTNSNTTYGVGAVNLTTQATRVFSMHPVTMRAQPTTTVSSCRIYDGVTASNVTSLGASRNSLTAMSMEFNCSGGGLIIGNPGLLIEQSGTGYIENDAEL